MLEEENYKYILHLKSTELLYYNAVTRYYRTMLCDTKLLGSYISRKLHDITFQKDAVRT